MIFDVPNPTASEKLSEIALWGGDRVVPTDSFAYVASGGLLNVIDITSSVLSRSFIDLFEWRMGAISLEL